MGGIARQWPSRERPALSSVVGFLCGAEEGRGGKAGGMSGVGLGKRRTGSGVDQLGRLCFGANGWVFLWGGEWVGGQWPVSAPSEAGGERWGGEEGGRRGRKKETELVGSDGGKKKRDDDDDGDDSDDGGDAGLWQ